MLTLAHLGLRGKAPEDWRSPRRCAHFKNHGVARSVLDCGGPPPLFPAAGQTVPMLTQTAIDLPFPAVERRFSWLRKSFLWLRRAFLWLGREFYWLRKGFPKVIKSFYSLRKWFRWRNASFPVSYTHLRAHETDS